MGVNDRMIFQTPGPEEMYVVKRPVEGIECPQCGSTEITRVLRRALPGPANRDRVPVLLPQPGRRRPAGGRQLASVDRPSYDWEASPAERASVVA